MSYADPEKQKQYQKEWYSKNRTKFLKERANWREKNPEKVRNLKRDWNAKNPVSKLLGHAKSRAKKIGVPFDLTVGDIERCVLC